MVGTANFARCISACCTLQSHVVAEAGAMQMLVEEAYGSASRYGCGCVDSSSKGHGTSITL
jgi:hypothetical protein